MIAMPVATVVLAAASALPAPETTDILTLEGCLQIARAQSPLVQASQARHEAATARIASARAWPYPIVGYDSDLQPRFLHFSQEDESYLGVSQLIEFPGKRGARGDVAAREADVVLAGGDLVRLSLAFEVKRTFGRLLLAQDKLAYVRQNLELAREFLRKTEHMLEVGDVARVEVLRARVEESKAANAERVAATGVYLARAHLAFLLARPAERPFDVEGQLGGAPVPGGLDALVQRALEARPEIRQIELALSPGAAGREAGPARVPARPGGRGGPAPDPGVSLDLGRHVLLSGAALLLAAPQGPHRRGAGEPSSPRA